MTLIEFVTTIDIVLSDDPRIVTVSYGQCMKSKEFATRAESLLWASNKWYVHCLLMSWGRVHFGLYVKLSNSNSTSRIRSPLITQYRWLICTKWRQYEQPRQ